MAECLEQLDADPERTEERSDHRGRPRVHRRDVAPEAEHRDARRAPRRRHDLNTLRIRRQTRTSDLECRARHTSADERPDLAAEPVHPADVRLPREVARVAEPRLVDVALFAGSDRNDLRHHDRLDAGELAQGGRVALGDRSDRVDATQHVALIASSHAPFGFADETPEAPLPARELAEAVALHVVLVQHHSRAG